MKKYWAEFLGTAVLVLMGCGGAVLAGDKIGFSGISLCFGFSIIALAYAIGPISGCHVNPAVSFGMLLTGKMTKSEFIKYVCFQIAGAVFGALLLLTIANGNPEYNVATNGLGANGFGELSPAKFNLASGFIAETVFTFLFVLVILGVTSSLGNATMAGAAIGITLVLIHLVGIPVTGVSVNPARSIGPALFAGRQCMMQLWLFIVAPMLGSALAAITWKTVFDNKRETTLPDFADLTSEDLV